MNPRFSLLVVLMLSLSSVAWAQTRTPFLSNLRAVHSSPLYTTYAAAMERAEFTLDKGYHFVFYDTTRGADFVNESGGDICLAFTKGGKYVHAVKDMYKPPVITMSYPDLAVYTFFPFKEVEVTVTFFVYSSHVAVQRIDLRNVTDSPVSIGVIPFLRNSARTYEQIKFLKEKDAMTFSHEEFPDDWVLDHKIPYVNVVNDVYAISDPPDRMTSFRSYQWGTVEIPQVKDLKKESAYLVWGRLNRPGGGRCSADPKATRIMVMLNGDRRWILTETAPRWGSAEDNINRYGYYGIELGNFGAVKEGARFTVWGMCGESGETGRVNGTVGKSNDRDSTRIDLPLGSSSIPRAPDDLKMDIWGSGTEVRLYWKKSDDAVAYNVYRRDYRAGGVYDLIGDNVRQTFFTDKNIPGDSVYGYVVVAVGPDGGMSIHSSEVNNIAGSDFLTDVRYPGQSVNQVSDLARVVAFFRTYDLRPGGMHRVVVSRAVARPSDTLANIVDTARGMPTLNMSPFIQANEQLFSRVPAPPFTDPDRQMLYWSAFSLMRQVMLPPEAKSHYNYYVFSREPQWGWGHGGQVFHESLTMLAYALMDPLSAMGSQRVYIERQKPDGYINYRTGSYLDEEIPYAGQLTTSAPWYAWQNWEIYLISHDRKFLEDSYASSAAFYRYYVGNRDADGDGLCEWGAHAVLESVRDAYVAVWDQVAWPSNFEAVDLNSMLVSEARSLAAMAKELGKTDEAARWEADATARTQRINTTMWDDTTGFYYNVDRTRNSFSFSRPNDLKREEIIGFLPLWAGIASKEQAAKLIAKLKDPKKFWRRYGVPSLSADDPYYNSKGYWNGPVWVQWDYLIVRGLLNYGYKDEARELTDRVATNMIAQLKADHNFWEFYSPDDQWAGYHKTYIWAGMINRMLLDVLQPPPGR
jgi:hypothetical protein